MSTRHLLTLCIVNKALKREILTPVTPEEVQRHENLKITLIFDCMIVIGAEFYVPNGAEGAVCLPTLPTLPFQRWGKKATLPTLLQSTG